MLQDVRSASPGELAAVAVKEIGKSSFVEEILNTEKPHKFVTPIFQQYDGNKDPVDHLKIPATNDHRDQWWKTILQVFSLELGRPGKNLVPWPEAKVYLELWWIKRGVYLLVFLQTQAQERYDSTIHGEAEGGRKA